MTPLPPANPVPSAAYGRTFDWRPAHDPRSRSFAVRPLLAQLCREPRSYTWPLPGVHAALDQGAEGACVGFAWAHELAAVPRIVEVSARSARLIYVGAQHLDEWPGVNYEGTSVLAGAKVVQALGHVPSYRWAFGLQDVVDTVGAYGPVVLGVQWHQGMLTPAPDGYVRPTGPVVGGHAILARGVNLTGRYVVLHNSWGPTWGDAGTARISFDDLGYLLTQMGEACVPVH
jgi:hypothetical protein